MASIKSIDKLNANMEYLLLNGIILEGCFFSWSVIHSNLLFTSNTYTNLAIVDFMIKKYEWKMKIELLKSRIS